LRSSFCESKLYYTDPSLRARKPGTDHENGEGKKKMGNEMRDNRRKEERGNVRSQSSHGARGKAVKTVFIMKYRNVFFEKDK
jgi:hypothetical protein